VASELVEDLSYARPAEPVLTGSTAPPAPLTRAVVALLGHIAAQHDLHRVSAAVKTPPKTLLRQIDRLEQVHGSPVARRVGARLALTELGHRLLVASRAFYVHVDGALDRAAGSVSAGRPVRLASALHLDAGLLHELATSDLPMLRVELHEARACLARYEDYEVDGALVWSMGERDGRCRRRQGVVTVVDDPLWVVLPEGHPLSLRRVLSLADLVDQPWVSGVDERGEPVVAVVFARHGLPVPARMQVAESASLAHCMGLRTGSFTLQSPSTIPDASWGAARPLAESPCRRLLLLAGATLSPAHLEQLAALVREHLVSRARRRLGDGHGVPDRGTWRSSQPLCALPQPGGSASAGEPAGASASPSAGASPRVAAVCGGRRRTFAAPYLLDFGDVEVLAAVSRLGSINRAAASLSMSQPALTRRLQRLEAELGVQLLLRDSRGARPTEFLERLLRGIEEAGQRFTGVVSSPARLGRVEAPRSS
jgi:DNA-binding transcriptional LysR family regulator